MLGAVQVAYAAKVDFPPFCTFEGPLERVSPCQIQDSPTGDVVIPCLETDMGGRRWARYIQ